MTDPNVNSALYYSSATTSKRIKNTTYAVPSFKRLSPSIKVDILFETPSSFNRDTTATGSVAEMIAPNRLQAQKSNPSSGNCKIYCIMTAVVKVHKRSTGPASIKIFQNDLLNV